MTNPTSKFSQTTPKTKAKTSQDSLHGPAAIQDYAQMLAFKLFFHGKGPAHYLVIKEADGCALSPRPVNGTLKTHSDSLLGLNAAGMGVFMAINSVQGNGSASDDKVTGINAVFIDADGTMELAAIKKLSPHLIVRTSPKKYHAYWLVKGLQVPMFKTVQKALAGKFGTDTSVNNPGRVMRMPGTIHQKASPVLVKIVHKTDDAKPVPIKRLLSHLGVKVEDAQDREAVISDSPAGDSELRSALFTIPVANDRETWLKVGMAIQNALPNEDGYALWEKWSKQSSAFQAKDQRKTWGSFKVSGGVTKATLFKLAQRHGWQQQIAATTLPVTEFQMVDEFANQVTGYLRYETTGGKWMLFESPVWLTDEARVVQASRRVVEPMIEQAATEGAAQAPKVLCKYSSIAGVRTLLREASARPDLNVSLGEFDRVPHLLALQNGVIDLRTAEFRAGQAIDMLRCQAPTKYDPDAKCPQFMEFLKFITCGRKEFAAYLQRALGYTLYGHTNEQVFFIAHGNSGNGKGTLFRLIGNVIGPFAKAVSPNLLSRAYAGNPNASSSAIMALNGPRMLQCGEGEERHRFDTAFIKQLSGSDPLSGRHNHGEQMEFTPVGKLWLSANHLPDVPQQDEAMWRRIRVLPFDAKIEKRDGAYEDALKMETAGVLNWMIKGAQMYAESGLGECDVVNRASARARRSADSVAAWIKERCKMSESARLQSSSAFDDYKKFCRSQDRQTLSVQRFKTAMTAKGHGSVETKRFNAFAGIQLIAP